MSNGIAAVSCTGVRCLLITDTETTKALGRDRRGTEAEKKRSREDSGLTGLEDAINLLETREA